MARPGLRPATTLETSLRFALAFLALAACGGSGSGLSKSATLSELSEDDWNQLCEWSADQMPTEAVECDDGTTVDPGTVEDCVTSSMKFYGSCDATVEEYEECIQVVGEDVCSSDLPAECAWAIACAFSSM